MTHPQLRIEAHGPSNQGQSKPVRCYYYGGYGDRTQYLLVINTQHLAIVNGTALMEALASASGALSESIFESRPNDVEPKVESRDIHGLELTAFCGLHPNDWHVMARLDAPDKLHSSTDARGEGGIAEALLFRGTREGARRVLQSLGRISLSTGEAKGYTGAANVGDLTYIISPILLLNPSQWHMDQSSINLFVAEADRMSAILASWSRNRLLGDAGALLVHRVASFMEQRGVLLHHQVLAGSEGGQRMLKKLQHMHSVEGISGERLGVLFNMSPRSVDVLLDAPASVLGRASGHDSEEPA